MKSLHPYFFLLLITLLFSGTLIGQTEIWSHVSANRIVSGPAAFLQNGNIVHGTYGSSFSKLTEYTRDGEEVKEVYYALDDYGTFIYLWGYSRDTLLTVNNRGEIYLLADDSVELIPKGNVFPELTADGTLVEVKNVIRINDTLRVRAYSRSNSTHESVAYYQEGALSTTTTSSNYNTFYSDYSPSGRKAELLQVESDFLVRISDQQGNVQFDSVFIRRPFVLNSIFFGPGDLIYLTGTKEISSRYIPVLFELDLTSATIDTSFFSPPAFPVLSSLGSFHFAEDRSLIVSGTRADWETAGYILALDRWGNLRWSYRSFFLLNGGNYITKILIDPESPQEIYVTGHTGITDVGPNFSSFILKLGIPVNQATQIESTPLQLFPNPTSDWLTLEYLPGTVKSIDVIDYTGRLMKSYSAETRINIKELPAGAYFIRAYVGEKIFVGRFIKE